MRRAGFLVLSLSLALPMAAQAQKPSSSMHTRSIENYLREARNTAHPEDRSSALDNALEVGVEGMQRDADNPLLWFLLGQIYVEREEMLKADSALDKAEAMWPEYRKEAAPIRETAWVKAYNLGVRALQSGDTAQAKEEFSRATLIFDGRPEAFVSLAGLQTMAGELEEAAAAYRRAIEIVQDPSTAELGEEIRTAWAEREEVATFNLARILADQEKYLEAAQLFEKFVERYPANVQARVNTALMYTQAGRAEDAARIYTDLLDQPGLDDVDYFNLGVGLYRADEHAQAATAFSKSVAANPYSRDALFNLGQAQFAHANELLEAGDTTAAVQVFVDLGKTAEQLIALDPAGQPAYMMLAQSQRTRVDLGGEAALRQAVLATLEKANALPFRVENVRMQVDGGTATISGSVVNGATLAAGTNATLQFVIVDRAGAELASKTVSVPLGAADEGVTFETEVPVSGTVAGWKYTIVE